MPLYNYRCPAGHLFERWLPVREYREPQNCECGQVGEKLILYAPMVQGDLPAYISPVTGMLISGRRAREEDLRVHGCVPYEPGMRQDMERRKAEEEAALDASVERTVGEFVEKLPAAQRESLGNFMESNEVGIERH